MWTLGDLALFTAYALALAMRESPVIGVISNTNLGDDKHGENENRQGEEEKRRA